jgi:hypothetical protein
MFCTVSTVQYESVMRRKPTPAFYQMSFLGQAEGSGSSLCAAGQTSEQKNNVKKQAGVFGTSLLENFRGDLSLKGTVSGEHDFLQSAATGTMI